MTARWRAPWGFDAHVTLTFDLVPGAARLGEVLPVVVTSATVSTRSASHARACADIIDAAARIATLLEADLRAHRVIVPADPPRAPAVPVREAIVHALDARRGFSRPLCGAGLDRGDSIAGAESGVAVTCQKCIRLRLASTARHPRSRR